MPLIEMGAAPKRRTMRLPGTITITAQAPKARRTAAGRRPGRAGAAKAAAVVAPAEVPERPPAPKSRKWMWILVVAAGLGAAWFLVKRSGRGRRGRRNPFGF